MNNKESLLLQEAERKRIAEELHDTAIQDMIYLTQQLELILLYMDRDVVQAKLEAAAARKHAKNVISGMRETIYDLCPLIFDDIGWKAAFERLRDKLSDRNPDLTICFDIDAVDTSDGTTAVSIYRIICEGCQNIVKHSGAGRIEVSVRNAGNFIEICIRDDGEGMEREKVLSGNHFGLQFMHERVRALSGKIKIVSDDCGTKINVTIPMEGRVQGK